MTKHAQRTGHRSASQPGRREPSGPTLMTQNPKSAELQDKLTVRNTFASYRERYARFNLFANGLRLRGGGIELHAQYQVQVVKRHAKATVYLGLLRVWFRTFQPFDHTAKAVGQSSALVGISKKS